MNLYIHIPFCQSKCYYCNVVSYTNFSSDIVEEYVNTLIKEIESRNPKKITTLYIGGGSPSLIKIKQYEKIFDFIHKNLSLSDNIEISIELNPNHINKDYLMKLKSLGINRLSFGIQSFNKNIMSKLNRDNGENLPEKFDVIFDIFENVNADLILGLPYSTFEVFKNDLHIITSYPFTHLSIYNYENYKELNNLPLQQELNQMIYYKKRFLLIKGYQQYEISNYARNNMVCRHNYDFWLNKNYLGFGLSAVSQIGDVIRENTSNLNDYIKHIKFNQYKMNKKEYNETVLLKQERIIKP